MTSEWYSLDWSTQARIRRFEPAALKAYVERLARKDGITIVYRGARWVARPGTKEVFIPPPIDEPSFGVALHELAHCLVEPCDRTTGHRAERLSDGATACLKCEERAWLKAMELYPPFSPRMHRLLRTALGSYMSTPAPVGVRESARRLTGGLAYAQHRHLAMKWQDRFDKVRTWRQR